MASRVARKLAEWREELRGGVLLWCMYEVRRLGSCKARSLVQRIARSRLELAGLSEDMIDWISLKPLCAFAPLR